MIAIALIVLFLFVGWIFLQIPLSNFDLSVLTFCMVAGLSAVVITVSTIVIKKLDSIQELLEEKKNANKSEKSE